MGQIIYSGNNYTVMQNTVIPLEIFRFNFGRHRSVVNPALGVLGPNRQARITFIGQFGQSSGSSQELVVKLWAGEIDDVLLVELPVTVPNEVSCFCKFMCTFLQRASGEIVLISEIYRSGGDGYNFILPLPVDIFEHIEKPLIITVTLGTAHETFIFNGHDVYAEYL